MKPAELSDALDGLFAYDSGCVDSGIHDEALRARVKAYLHGLPDGEFRAVLSRHVREMMLTEDRLAQGYGIEDVASFIRWLSDSMDIDL